MTDISLFARDMVLLLANKKLCRIIAKDSPAIAIDLFKHLSEQKALYSSAFETVTRNLSSAFINDTDSLLYHEDDGYDFGLLGYVKPLSKAIYGDYGLIEMLGHRSPLDIHYKEIQNWSAEQLQKYSQCVLLTVNSFLEQDQWYIQSYVLNRALSSFESQTCFVYKLNDIDGGLYDSEIYKKFEVVINFANDLIVALSEAGDTPDSYKLKNKDKSQIDLYDRIAMLISTCVHVASKIRISSWDSHSIQHNLVWATFFDFGSKDDKAERIVLFKVRRLIYDHIIKLERSYNMQAAGYLGFCLNVLGVIFTDRKHDLNNNSWPLKKVVINWTKKNFLRLHKEAPEVFERAVLGSITFCEKNNTLVKTYIKMPGREAHKEVMKLELEKKVQKFYY
ncbi:MAG: hypothetical protein ACI9T7_002554 [Oleiphilaceae bacterium]|jgi:hypothetical protein